MKPNYLSWFQYQNDIYKYIWNITILKIFLYFSSFLYEMNTFILSLISNINKSPGLAKIKLCWLICLFRNYFAPEFFFNYTQKEIIKHAQIFWFI